MFFVNVQINSVTKKFCEEIKCCDKSSSVTDDFYEIVQVPPAAHLWEHLWRSCSWKAKKNATTSEIWTFQVHLSVSWSFSLTIHTFYILLYYELPPRMSTEDQSDTEIIEERMLPVIGSPGLLNKTKNVIDLIQNSSTNEVKSIDASRILLLLTNCSQCRNELLRLSSWSRRNRHALPDVFQVEHFSLAGFVFKSVLVFEKLLWQTLNRSHQKAYTGWADDARESPITLNLFRERYSFYPGKMLDACWLGSGQNRDVRAAWFKNRTRDAKFDQV